MSTLAIVLALLSIAVVTDRTKPGTPASQAGMVLLLAALAIGIYVAVAG